ncbi:MAG TPA: hypothetical protein VEH84_14565 [Alphaproteobacteria bacterium]|nr:hypothetical protein [Alphaproteobacteria bacterium]
MSARPQTRTGGERGRAALAPLRFCLLAEALPELPEAPARIVPLIKRNAPPPTREVVRPPPATVTPFESAKPPPSRAWLRAERAAAERAAAESAAAAAAPADTAPTQPPLPALPPGRALVAVTTEVRPADPPCANPACVADRRALRRARRARRALAGMTASLTLSGLLLGGVIGLLL